MANQASSSSFPARYPILESSEYTENSLWDYQYEQLSHTPKFNIDTLPLAIVEQQFAGFETVMGNLDTDGGNILILISFFIKIMIRRLSLWQLQVRRVRMIAGLRRNSPNIFI